MAAIAASDVTVSITDHWISNKKRHIIGTITFGDGSLTYPTKGVPLPAIAQLGFSRNMDSFAIVANNELTTDYMALYNSTTHGLLLYEEEATAAGGPLLEADTSEAPAARTYTYFATGW